MRKGMVYKQKCRVVRNCGLRKGDSHKNENFDRL